MTRTLNFLRSLLNLHILCLPYLKKQSLYPCHSLSFYTHIAMSPLEILNVYELSICLPLVMDNVCSLSQFLYWPLSDTSVPQSWACCPQELLLQRGLIHPKMGVQGSNPFPSRCTQRRRNSYFKFPQWDHFEACLHVRLNSCLVFTSPTKLFFLCCPPLESTYPLNEPLAQEFTPRALFLWKLMSSLRLDNMSPFFTAIFPALRTLPDICRCYIMLNDRLSVGGPNCFR